MFDWILSRKLDRIGRRANPDRAFLVALEKRLRPGPTKHTALWKVAMTSATSMSVLFLGTGTYAYASENVLPDHPLYGVRQTIEYAESALAFTPTLKARVGVHLMSRRLMEEERIVQQRNAVTPEQVGRFIRQAEQAIDASHSANPRVGARLDATIASLEQRHALLLERLRMEGADATSQRHINAWLDDQTKRLQERIRALPASRQERYRELLQRRLTAIEPSVDFLPRANEVLRELEDAFREVNAGIDQETRVMMEADDVVAEDAGILDIFERSVVDEE